METRAQQRLMVLTHVLAGELGHDEAPAILGLSIRQVRRLLDRYRADGAAAFVHRNHGRTPANRVDDVVRTRIVELATTTYAGFNPVHLAHVPDESARSASQALLDAAVWFARHGVRIERVLTDNAWPYTRATYAGAVAAIDARHKRTRWVRVRRPRDTLQA